MFHPVLRMIWLVSIVAILFAANAISANAKPPAPPKPSPVENNNNKRDGFQFPGISTPYFQYEVNKPFAKKAFDFSQVVGKTPFVMFYFLPQHTHSVTELKAYAMIASMLGKNMKFLAVTKASTKEEVKAAYEKIKSLKLTLPVLLDEKGLLAYVMLTQRVPAYAIVTKSGRFTLARAGALTEKVDAKQTLLGMLTQVSRGGEPEFTMAPGYSPNPFNLVGQMAPELEVHELVGQGKWQLQNHVKKHNKPIVLVFWSLTCPHCRKIIPGVQQYISDNQKSVDVRSLIILHDKQHVEMLDVLRKEINLTMPVLNDPKGDAFNRYHIMTVPTFFVVDKSGKIIGAYIGGGKDVAKSIDQILKSGG